MYYKKFRLATSSLLTLLILSACASMTDSVPVVETEAPMRNSLSGRIGSDGPILVVKIDDTRASRPQIGLEDADIVYIEQVEGGLTRLAAVFSSTIPTIIGPVRSARISDIDILEQFGRVAFAYSGAQKKLLPVIDAANLINLGAQRQPSTIYSNDPLRNSPTAMILQAQTLMAKVKDSGEPIAVSKKVGWSFGEAPDTGTVISAAKVRWPANSYEATWSKSQERWLLSNSGIDDFSASGIHLGPTTFVIQVVSVTPSIYGDKFGGVTPFIQTVGSGAGYILRDGKAISARWSRPTASDGTNWIDVNGEEITFAPGQIWVALTDVEPEFTYPAPPSPTPSASPST